MFEIGNSLREARERRGIDFAQAELATKIRGKYLRALEDEQFAMLPAQTYVKGFLRTYAEYLGLDGQLYVDEFNSRFVSGGDEHEPRVRRSQATRPRQRLKQRLGTCACGWRRLVPPIPSPAAWCSTACSGRPGPFCGRRR